MTTATKKSKLDDIKQRIIDHKICASLAETAQNLVFGDGNEDAEIMFIGEAPGKNEDIQGLPFVGSAGKLLDQMLDSIGLKRASVYITNIVKYRPPNNRDPLPEEKEAFLPFLEEQISIINPKLIVTLGRHSLNCFLPDLRITEVHGQPKRYKGRVYLPLYHPAAALYNGVLKQVLFDDFLNIPSILELIK